MKKRSVIIVAVAAAVIGISAVARAPEHVLRGQAQLAVALIVCAIDMWVDVSPGVTVMIPAIIQVISRVAWKET